MDSNKIDQEAMERIVSMRQMAEAALTSGSTEGILKRSLPDLDSLAVFMAREVLIFEAVEARLEETRRFYEARLPPALYERWLVQVFPEIKKTYERLKEKSARP